MSHFLEHIPCSQDVAAIVRNACQLSREFVFIRQPWFDSDGLLFRHGLKLFWSHWAGHPNPMTMLQLHNTVEALRQAGIVKQFTIYAQGPIADSSHEAVHPLTSPIDQHSYDPEKHGTKPELSFEEPIYSETLACIDLDGNSTALIESIFHEADRMFTSSPED